jgi:hypothetical protein
MTIDINFVDAAKLEIVIFDYLWIGWNAGWCNDSSLLVGASTLRPQNGYRGSIFRPQTRRVCEIAVLQTQIAGEKSEDWIRSVEKISFVSL